MPPVSTIWNTIYFKLEYKAKQQNEKDHPG